MAEALPPQRKKLPTWQGEKNLQLGVLLARCTKAPTWRVIPCQVAPFVHEKGLSPAKSPIFAHVDELALLRPRTKGAGIQADKNHGHGYVASSAPHGVPYH
ncbi:hypothetical protein H6A07_07845 [Olsenella uli]|uniref:hypothetical protein n=1 Tax=Olsenella uli TaxID=133926 RepID=UPI00195EFF56|nr:hypothetical protein [Olsenella uli]MBM6676651.1 hypothetical protein [Olsenella uli]